MLPPCAIPVCSSDSAPMSARVTQGYAMVIAAYLLVGAVGHAGRPDHGAAERPAGAALRGGARAARRLVRAPPASRGPSPRSCAGGCCSWGRWTRPRCCSSSSPSARPASPSPTFLYFMQPVWIALLAPRLLGSSDREGRLGGHRASRCRRPRRSSSCPLSWGVAHVSWSGLAAGLACGLLYACFALLVKDLSDRLDSVTLVLTEFALDLVFLLPLALWQTRGGGLRPDAERPAGRAGAGRACAPPSPTRSGWKGHSVSGCSTAPCWGF